MTHQPTAGEMDTADRIADAAEETTIDRHVRLITERRDTIADIRATYDLTNDERREYQNESTMLANLSIAVIQFGFDGLGDEDQFTIDGLVEVEDDNIKGAGR